MQSLVTVGREIFKDYSLMLCIKEEDRINSEEGFGERLKIIFVEEGSGIINIGGKRQLFIGPVIFCFNENECYTLESQNSIKAQTIWFHPSIINKIFDFCSIRKNNSELSDTEIQDVFWLEVFINRPENFHGQLNVGPGTSKRIKDLFESIRLELDTQRDNHWPCRSRTFLIELLFLIQRVSTIPESSYSIEISNDQGDAGEILLYLYSNYSRKITIEELTESFHINRTSLNRLFNQVTGMSVMNYLIKLRVYLAAQMLQDTILPVSEIINRVGFNDATHFGRLFKKHYGYSATEYRDRNCWMLK